MAANRLPDYARQYYNLSDQHLHELKEQLRTLLEKNCIAPSQAPVAAPVFFVAKKDGGLRMVIDYRPLNAITIREDYPCPRIHDLINRLGKAKWFSTLDLQQGYYQVEVAADDQWKTAFRTLYGTYQFRVVHALKEALINAATLKIFDPDKSITIKTDASKYATGAVLEQEGVPVAFESRKLSGREQYMPAYEGELVAIVHALLKWRPFIGSKAVTTETDHATLGRILKQKNVTTRLGYWLYKLADFNINAVYKPGKQNVVADAISRRQDYICLIHSNETQVDLPDIQNLDK
ncbi:retrotransposon ty3-gypsy subclass [Cystoisospora suis]|uniref:Retrotransposon ty3-gypsy subclass n=1 Tax=Cystoisospora suis TaxID=483139 RepID=A0A2C6KS01_9APIC|nr:retrotransposon ty3-gypsy subclass [Cystoisospora suis]